MKTKRILALLFVAVMAFFSLTACLEPTVAETGDVTVVVETESGEYEVYKTYLENVENKETGAVGVLENLRDREKNPLSINMSDSSYGKYIHSIGSITEDTAAKKYIMVYTSLERDFGTWAGVSELTYDGVTLKSVGVGVSSMSVEAGTIILFRLEASAW